MANKEIAKRASVKPDIQWVQCCALTKPVEGVVGKFSRFNWPFALTHSPSQSNCHPWSGHPSPRKVVESDVCVSWVWCEPDLGEVKACYTTDRACNNGVVIGDLFSICLKNQGARQWRWAFRISKKTRFKHQFDYGLSQHWVWYEFFSYTSQ